MSAWGRVSFAWVLRDYAKSRIETLRNTLRNFETSLATELLSLEDHVKSVMEGLPESEAADYGELYSDDHWELRQVMPDVLRRTMFVTSYSLLEHEMNGACRILERELAPELPFKDAKGEGIQRARGYMKNPCELKFPECREWDRIEVYNKIRNFIAHGDGVLDESGNAKVIRQKVRAVGGYSVDENNRLVLGENFCFRALDDIEGFLEQLADAMDARVRKWVRDR